MSAEKVTTPTTADNSFSPSITENTNFCSIFKGSCLKPKNATINPPNIIYFFIVYELDTWSWYSNSQFILKDCLFRGIKLV